MSPFVGRHDDNGFDGMQLISDIRLIYDNYAFGTEILVASVRHGIHVLEAAKIGADVMTAPPAVIMGMVKHVLTDKGIEGFMADWAKTGQKINSIDYNGGVAEIKAMVEAGNVTWDVVDMEIADAQRACDEGLLEKIDAGTLPAAPDGTPAVQDFVRKFRARFNSEPNDMAALGYDSAMILAAAIKRALARRSAGVPPRRAARCRPARRRS